MRIALGVEYDGSKFYGWQRQKLAESVQETLEEAVSEIANRSVEVYAAGRTDSGVHATEQVVHFDTHAVRDSRSWIMGINVNLPHSISVLWAREMREDFHARHSAMSRCYRYVILDRPTRPSILSKKVTWTRDPLDHVRMQDAASFLKGTHDFSAYRASSCQSKSPVRTIHRLTVHRLGEFVYVDIVANGFLHHMVRNIAGVLMTIGKGEQEATWARTILESRDREAGGVTGPAPGLYLVKVQYDHTHGFSPAVRWPAIGMGLPLDAG